jgi:Protein of unknown function (DUF3500)
MKKQSLVSLSIVAGLTTVVAAALFAQLGPQQGPRGGGGASLSEPFKGITTNGKIDEGLFKIESTGVTTKPVVDAALAFLDGLSEEQKKRTVFPVDDVEWRQWDNRHMSKRQGVGFDEMDEAQRNLAFDLMGKSLSAKGLKLSQDIMKLNGTLAELANNNREYGEWLYWITIMGTPSETEAWGWQIDGHHLVINYFVLGDQVAMSPVFIGSEPVHATSGKFAGTIILQDEQNAGLAFMQSLSEAQQKEATITSTKPGNNNLTEAYKDNANVDLAGLIASKLDEKQRAAFLKLIGQYVGNMRDGHAKVKMSEVERHLEKTYFAWVGGTSENSVYYYRIHSPVVLIEFDHQRRVAPFRSGEPSRDHIHAVIRTPNGNDYGKDLLRQHLEQHHRKSDK